MLVQLVLANLMLQAFLGFVLSCVLKLHVNNNRVNSSDWLMHRLLTIPLLLPTSLALLGGTGVFQYLSVISIIPAAVVSLYILTRVRATFLCYIFQLILSVLFIKVAGVATRSVINTMRTKRQFVLNFGFNTFLEAEWVRLRIPSLLRTFWLTRMTQQLLSIVVKSGDLSDQILPYSDAAARAAISYMLDVGRELVIRGAETLIALLGMTRYVTEHKRTSNSI